MWRRGFIATSVALGSSVDDALAAIGAPGDTWPTLQPGLGIAAHQLTVELRAPERSARASSLAVAVRDVVLAIDEATLR